MFKINSIFSKNFEMSVKLKVLRIKIRRTRKWGRVAGVGITPTVSRVYWVNENLYTGSNTSNGGGFHCSNKWVYILSHFSTLKTCFFCFWVILTYIILCFRHSCYSLIVEQSDSDLVRPRLSQSGHYLQIYSSLTYFLTFTARKILNTHT